jgi:hypothetical protein
MRGWNPEFWENIIRDAVLADARYNKKITQQVKDEVIEYKKHNRGFLHKSPDGFGIIDVLKDHIPADFYLLFGDAPGQYNFRIVSESQRPTLILTPTVYFNEAKEKLKSVVHTIGPECYSLYFDDYNNQFSQQLPIKDCVCLINRMDPMRQSWLYQLVRNNLFDRSFVSFNMDTTRLFEFRDLPPDRVFEEQYKKYLTIFEHEHQLVRNIVPYRNFAADIDLDALLMQSKFNIVLETYFANNDELTFTEKIIRSLRLPRPWLLFSSMHAVDQLRKWGFDTLDDLVDHSYDSIESDIQRQSAILQQAQKMCDFDVEKHWPRLAQASCNNLSLLKTWKDNRQATGTRDIANALDKIYNLYGTY